MRTREFTTVGQNRTREPRDMVNSRVRTREFTTVGQNRTREIRDMVNSRVCARASLPLLAKIARAKFATWSIVECAHGALVCLPLMAKIGCTPFAIC